MKGCYRTYCADVAHCMVPDNCGQGPQIATGHALDALVERYRIVRKEGETDHELRHRAVCEVQMRESVTRIPDFRDGRREYRLTVHEIAQQDGFPNDD